MKDALDVLIEHESQNMSIINGLRIDKKTCRESYEKIFAEKGWNDEEGLLIRLDAIFWSHPQKLSATVKDSNGETLLIAYCTYPYKTMTLFCPRNNVNTEAVKLFADELKSHNFIVRKVRAEQNLATCFAEAYGDEFSRNASMYLMQTEKSNEVPSSKGFCRNVEEGDLFFVPFWDAECLNECRQDPMSLDELHEYHEHILYKRYGFLWVDNFPVSQVFITVVTENCALIGDVYTPLYYRKKGYATSLMAEVSRIILYERGKEKCVLFVDTENHAACEIYRKVGYNEICIVDEIKKAGVTHDV
jgi:hypothetical protein